MDGWIELFPIFHLHYRKWILVPQYTVVWRYIHNYIIPYYTLSIVLFSVHFPSPSFPPSLLSPWGDSLKFTPKSIWFIVKNYHTTLYMSGIIWNVSVRLVQMSHSQRSKPRGNNVFKSLEVSCLQRMVGLSCKLLFYPQKV